MNTTLLVIILVFSVIFTGLNFLLLLILNFNSHKLIQDLSVFRLRIENIYEKFYKTENILQIIMQNMMSDNIFSSMPPEHSMKAIRTPGGIIMASSLEDFLAKIRHDPEFKGISKEQLEELRRLFEEGNSNDNDGDDHNEPWKKEK